MPLIGRVRAQGLTTAELEHAIAGAPAAGLYARPERIGGSRGLPAVLRARRGRRSPGNIPFINGMTVQNAIAVAGGFTPRALEEQRRHHPYRRPALSDVPGAAVLPRPPGRHNNSARNGFFRLSRYNLRECDRESSETRNHVELSEARPTSSRSRMSFARRSAGSFVMSSISLASRPRADTTSACSSTAAGMCRRVEQALARNSRRPSARRPHDADPPQSRPVRHLRVRPHFAAGSARSSRTSCTAMDRRAELSPG